jgi:hypothetical protein
MGEVMWKTAVALIGMLLSQNAFAGEADIGPLVIERVGIIATATGQHIAGNMEVKIENSFVVPSGLSCDNNFITTKKTTDPDRAMFYMLLKAQTVRKPVFLRITDDATLRAYPGRCSIELVDLR